jgi:hypothetical protein
MISPLQAAQLARAIYAPVDPGVFVQAVQVDGVTAGVARIGCNTVIAFAGSENARDWLRDFRAVPWRHPQLGTLHAGFWDGMQDTYAALQPVLQRATPVDGPVQGATSQCGLGHGMKMQDELIITGHSLGCAHAAILAGLCAVDAIAVTQLTLFAPPRPSYRALRDIVTQHVPHIAAYRNGRDPVPEVPLALPLLEPWSDIAPLTPLDAAPEDADDIFAWHAIDLYVAALSSNKA